MDAIFLDSTYCSNFLGGISYGSNNYILGRKDSSAGKILLFKPKSKSLIQRFSHTVGMREEEEKNPPNHPLTSIGTL